MGRAFVRASNQGIILALNGMTTLPFGTAAMVVRNTGITFSGGIYGSIMSIDSAGDDGLAFFINGDAPSAGGIATYNGTGGAVSGVAGVTTPIADGWVLVAWTKATGTVAPRFHRFRWSAGDWVHAVAGATDVNPALTMNGFRLGFNHGGVDAWDGDMAALMILPGVVMSDSDIERLPAGNWSRWTGIGSTSFLREFRSGRDNPVLTGGRDIGRGRTRETTMTAVTRTAGTDPPGFRFSPQTRRS